MKDFARPVSDESPADEVDSIEGDFHLSGVVEDRALVDRCLGGDASAWEDLYCHCHAPLLSSINVLLGGGAADPNLVDEIAARVWYRLIVKDGQVLGQYEARGDARLMTFLRTVAQTEVHRHFRSERRRQGREQIAQQGKPQHEMIDNSETAEAVDIEAFVKTLTARQRQFWERHFATGQSGEGDSGRRPLSANHRQLRHRIREKLLRFLGNGP